MKFVLFWMWDFCSESNVRYTFQGHPCNPWEVNMWPPCHCFMAMSIQAVWPCQKQTWNLLDKAETWLGCTVPAENGHYHNWLATLWHKVKSQTTWWLFGMWWNPTVDYSMRGTDTLVHVHPKRASATDTLASLSPGGISYRHPCISASQKGISYRHPCISVSKMDQLQIDRVVLELGGTTLSELASWHLVTILELGWW